MSRNVTTEEHDPRSRFGLYRLCRCEMCMGIGRVGRIESRRLKGLERCPDCRGEGRIRQEVASCETPEAVGVALVTLAREGEFEECQFGLLDRDGEKGQRWLVLPWPSTARTVSAAGSLLAKSKKPSA